MKDLIIVGASGFGMEVAWMAERCGRKVLGFLDDSPEKIGKKVLDYKVLGTISSWQTYQDCEFILAIGSPRGRQVVAEKMEASGKPSYTKLIDPSAIIGDSNIIEEGAIICAGVVFTVSIKIGRHCIVNLNSTVGHEAKLGNFCTVAPGVSISGNVTIGDHVELGTGAVIREKVYIGNGAVIGMGGVLVNDANESRIFVGNPAKQLK